jgi:hypothetical protein
MTGLFEESGERRLPEKQSSAAEKIREKIKGCVAYHDTVAFILNDLSVKLDLEDLLENAVIKGALDHYSMKAFNRQHGDRRILQYRVDLTQPSKEFLLKLDELLRYSHYRLIRVDTAYDFVLVHIDDQIEVRTFFEQRAVLKRATSFPDQYDATSYLSKLENGEKMPTENIAVYVDKKSIFNDAPNVHVERRRHDKRNVLSSGILTFRALALYDFDARIGEDLCLYEVSNKSEIGKLLLKAERWEGKDPEKAGLRAFNKTFESEQFVAQTIWFDHKKGRKFLKPICMKPLRPVLGFGG